MRKFRLPILLMLVCLMVMLLAVTVSAAPQNGWYQEDGEWYYYRDGSPVMDEVLEIGGARYAFRWDGTMLDNYEALWVGDGCYRALPNGKLMTNQWYNEYDEYWYYYGADGKGVQDFYTVAGKEYYFYADGALCTDSAVYSNKKGGIFAISEDGTQHKALDKQGWNEAFGEWYYIQGDDYLYDELLTVGQNRFWFFENGQMAADCFLEFWNEETGNGIYGYFDANGYLKTGWFKVGNDWAYAGADGGLYGYGVYQIDGKLYLFEGYRMYAVPGEYDGHYITGSGALLRNQWYKDTTGYQNQTGWAYYDDSGYRAYDFWEIDGAYYYFNWDGIMVTNEVHTTELGVLRFGKDGKGTLMNGWFTHPESGVYMYAKDGHLINGVAQIDGVTYGFEDHFLVDERAFWNYDGYDGTYYLCDKNGHVIQKPGWHLMNGYWYYVQDATGVLAQGIVTIGGKTYSLVPEMETNTLVWDDESACIYVADSKGVCTKFTSNGLQMAFGSLFFTENGKLVKESWRWAGGKWYYFDENGYAIRGGCREIDGVKYVFNEEGEMVTNGWEYRYYADKNGVAVDGLVTIGGKQYLFVDNVAQWAGIVQWEGVNYLIAPDGVILGSAAKKGWNLIGSDWYYVDEEGNLLCECLLTENGVTYGFGEDGRMCKDGIRYAWYDYYMFDAKGKVLSGWQKIDGKWYYADPQSGDPYIYTQRTAKIDGKKYVFKYTYLEIGTFIFGQTIYTTDANGAVISETAIPDGWTYSDGDVIYRKNGAPYTGWVGDYYVYDGYMLFNQKIQYGDKYYYLGTDGRYLKKGFYRNDGYILAVTGDGSLHSHGWYQHGNDWYYFVNGYAVWSELIEIDGKWHYFDGAGKWLGEENYEEVSYPAKSDGWHMIDGEWYYYLNGERQYGFQYINGKIYFLRYEDGAMVTNDFDYDGMFYFGADGVRAEYVGWKLIDGEWVYFNKLYSPQSGFISSGSGWYYCEYNYNGEKYPNHPTMLTNVGVVRDSRLYHFGSDGYCAGFVNKTGWYQIGSEWYYLENGYVVDGYRVINGVGYYFYEGYMMTEVWEYATVNGKDCRLYFGADGKQITKDGWYQTSWGQWVYIQKGEVLTNGIYKINGKDYCFQYGYWVE